jgi:histidinol-phosphatase (PHP family)
LDNLSGPSFEDYIPVADAAGIHITFLEHLQTARFYDANPLRPDTMPEFLEAFDEAKSQYSNMSVGFETDYYPDHEEELAEFLDTYSPDVDWVVGTVHELPMTPLHPFTIADDLRYMLRTHSFAEIVEQYFEVEEQMVQSGLFAAIAHPDVIFRFCGDTVPADTDWSNDVRLLELGKLCRQKMIRVEFNIRGLHYPCRRPFPSVDVARIFMKMGVQMFVGSDSHSVADFAEQVDCIKKANEFVKGWAKDLDCEGDS